MERMYREAKVILGAHDFTSFRGSKCTAKTPVKEILESELVLTEPYLRYRVVGCGFLKQMVRNIVGTLVWMGQGKISMSMEELLALRDRRKAGVTAPGCGLCMDWVKY